MNFLKTLRTYKIHHVVFWILYCVFWIFLEHTTSWRDVTIITLLFAISNALAAYLTAYLFVPKLLLTKKYFTFFLVYIVTIVLTAYLIYGGCYLFYKNKPEGQVFASAARYVYTRALSSELLITIVFSAYKIIQQKFLSDHLNTVLKAEKAETELNFLKAQINPHFLFNAINNIYFLISKDPDLAKKTLLKVSDLLRYQLYECSARYTPIEKELEYLKNFIELETLRKGDKIKVTTEFENLSGFNLSPFIFLPFIENAFKYVFAPENRIGTIHIKLQKRNQLMFEITNSTDDALSQPPGGIGLQNVKRRLDLLYPGRYHLDITNRADYFGVSLNIHVDANQGSNN